MQRQMTGYLLLLLFAAFTWWLVERSEPDEMRLAVPPHSADYFSTGYRKIEMNLQGKPENRLDAEKMTHYSDDDTTVLERSVMTFYKTDALAWLIKSETGLRSPDGKLLYLNGKVVIEQFEADGEQKLRVNTSNVRVKPAKKYAETDEWGEIITSSDWVSGTGMQIFFAEPVRLRLLSNVRSIYAAK